LFSLERSKFTNDKGKEGTGRMYCFNELGINRSYTLESSYYAAK